MAKPRRVGPPIPTHDPLFQPPRRIAGPPAPVRDSWGHTKPEDQWAIHTPGKKVQPGPGPKRIAGPPAPGAPIGRKTDLTGQSKPIAGPAVPYTPPTGSGLGKGAGGKGPKIVRPAASPTGGTTHTSSPTTTGGKGGSGSHAPAASGKGGKGGKGGKKITPAATRAAATTTTAAPESPAITADSIYDPAFQALDKSAGRLDAGRMKTQADLDTYNKWLADQDTANRDWVGKQWDAVGAQSAAAQQAMGDQTRQVSGGNADLERMSGIDNAQTQADMANNPGALSRAALARQIADSGAARGAMIANLKSTANQGYNDKLAELDTNRASLTVDKGKLASDIQSTAAKNALDQKTYELMATEKMGNLGVAQANAETKRLQVLTTAETARQRAALTAELGRGRLSLGEARLRLDTYMKGQGLTLQQRRLELQKLQQDGKARTAAGSLLDKKYDAVYGKNGTRVWDKDRTADRQFVRQTITALHGAYPGLSQAEAIQLISGRFPGALRVVPGDPYPLLQQVRSLWQ